MTELDFLPDWYFVRIERRRSYMVHIWLAAGLLAVCGMWFYLAHSRIGECRADLRNLKAERTSINEHLLRIDRQRAVRDDLRRKSAIAARLHNRPDAIDAIDRLVKTMPDDVGLVSLDLESEVVVEPQAARPKGPTKFTTGAKPAAAAPPKPAEPRVHYLLRLTGVAPVDVTVANLIARLSASEVFSEVQMGYAKDVKRDGRVLRQFELTCRLPETDRLFRSPQEPGGAREASAADGARQDP